MDVELDSLINNNRRPRGGRRGGRGGNRDGGFGGGASRNFSEHDDRGDERSGGGAFRRSRATQRNSPYGQSRRNQSDTAVWEHDRFDEDEDDDVEEFEPSRGAGFETGTKLEISNLDFGVSDQDIKDLFEPLGDLKKSNVQYDQSGRSLGTATVVFARRDAALKALQQYNKVPLDGKPMEVKLVGGKVGGGGGRGGGGRNSRGNNRNDNDDDDDFGGGNARITISVPAGGGGGGGGPRRRISGGSVGRRAVTVRSRAPRVNSAGGGGGGGGGRRGRGGRGGGAGRQLYVRF